MHYFPNSVSSDADDTANDLAFACDAIAQRALQLHKSLPNYAATPCRSLHYLAGHLGINKLWVKDESQRFDLKAFKVLGASYAIASLLHEWLNLPADEFSFDAIREHQSRYAHLTLVTATDGNHGRAVAWAAQQFGCAAKVFMPHGSLTARAEAIRHYGAHTQITELTYDDTVRFAAQTAQAQDHFLIQDTAWEGYHDTPLVIQQGYFSLLSEALEQLEPTDWPTHVLVQAGVGSLPAALAARLHVLSYDRPTPQFIVVEPTLANCLFQSMANNQGQALSLPGHLPTIMAGLACGTPSAIALTVLRSYATGFLCCDDDIAERGMRVLGNPLATDPRIVSGESGAVTLGAVFELCRNPAYAEIRTQIGLNSDAKVLLFSTEGDTASEFYRDIVWNT